MYTGNHLCIDSHVVWASCVSQCVCEREADRAQGITVNMSRGQHSWAVFISACSPSLFHLPLSPFSSSSLPFFSLSLSPSPLCVCIVDESDVDHKYVCPWMFGEEGSLCTFSMCVCVYVNVQFTMWGGVYFGRIYEWRGVVQGFQLWVHESVRMVQRFSLRRQYSKVSLKHTSLFSRKTTSVSYHLNAAAPFIAEGTDVLDFCCWQILFHLFVCLSFSLSSSYFVVVSRVCVFGYLISTLFRTAVKMVKKKLTLLSVAETIRTVTISASWQLWKLHCLQSYSDQLFFFFGAQRFSS